MRLFVAVYIDDRTRAQLRAAREAIQSVVDRARVPPRLTWVKDESAHVTMRFIGEASESTAAKIEQALTTPWALAPFDVRWERLGAFPNARRPRVLWVGPAFAEDLARLAAAVSGKVDPLIGAGEARPFTPHVTLARVKDAGKAVEWSRALDARRWVTTVTRVDHVTLYLSRPSSKGPTYTALCKAHL
jgi:2'-5' RNA ligase